MTCIVGLVEDGKVYIGGDSCVSHDNGTYEIMTGQSKIFRAFSNQALIGVAGSPRTAQLTAHLLQESPRTSFAVAMRDILRDGGNLKVENGLESMDSNFLVAFEGRLFRFGANFGIVEFARGYEAIGSGEQFALGNLYLTYPSKELTPYNKVMNALEAAAAFTSVVREPFYVEVL